MFVKPLLDFEDKSMKNFFFFSNLSMWITDADLQTILEINHTAIKTYGYKREEILLQPVEKIIPQNEQQKLLRLPAGVSDVHQITKEICLISHQGKKLYAETTVSATLFNGKEARLFIMTDVTEKKLYRTMLEEAIDEEISLKSKNEQLINLAYSNFHLARKPLANILGLVNVLDESVIVDQTLLEAIEFLRESSNQLDELIKNLDPQQY